VFYWLWDIFEGFLYVFLSIFVELLTVAAIPRFAETKKCNKIITTSLKDYKCTYKNKVNKCKICSTCFTDINEETYIAKSI